MDANTIVQVLPDATNIQVLQQSTKVIVPSDAFFTDALVSTAQAADEADAARDEAVAINAEVTGKLSDATGAASDATTAELGAESAYAGILAALDGVTLSSATIAVEDQDALAILDHTLGLPAFMKLDNSYWVPVATNLSAQVAIDRLRAWYIAFSTDATGASGAWVRADDKTDPRQFGAADDGVTDCIDALFQMAVLVSYGYCPRHIVINGADGRGTGVYVMSHVLWRDATHGFPAGALRDSVEAFSGAFTTKGSLTQSGPVFVNVNGLTIEGRGKPIIKRADNGCQTENSLMVGNGLMNFKGCANVRVFGCEFDCNRLGQIHTNVFSGAGPANFGPSFASDCDNIDVYENVFRNSGTLVTGSDKFGDDLFFWSGVHRATVRNNRFFDPGRCCLTFERPEPRGTDDDTTQDKNIRVLHNHFEMGFPQDGATQLLAMDVEPWAAAGFFELGHNYFKGGAKVSFGSSPNSASQVVDGIYVHDNVFDWRGSVAAFPATLIPLNISASWVNAIGGGAAVRRYRNLRIENNRLYCDKALAATAFINVVSCVVTNGRFSGNAYTGPLSAPTSGIVFNGFFEGEVLIEHNDFSNLGTGIQFGGWHDPGGTAAAYITIRNNIGYGISWGVRAVVAVPAFPSGSRLELGSGNTFIGAGGMQIDATAFVAGGGLAIRRPGSIYVGPVMTFTGFTATDTAATVTQATSKATGVTLSRQRGQVVMNAAALAAGAEVSFTLTNTQFLADDSVNVWVKGGASDTASYRVRVSGSTAGQRKITLTNVTAGSLSEAVVIGFAVV